MRGKLAGCVNRLDCFGITPADAGKTGRRKAFQEPTKDHPRGCGENNGFRSMYYDYAGSPPRMRGKQSSESEDKRPLRITPADAGKTTCQGRRRRRTKDHPRGCGENLPIPDKRLGTLGSPPRMRGKHIFHWYSGICARITPADAGKTGFFVGNMR